VAAVPAGPDPQVRAPTGVTARAHSLSVRAHLGENWSFAHRLAAMTMDVQIGTSVVGRRSVASGPVAVAERRPGQT